LKWSGTGLRIAYSVVLSIPFVGEWLAFLLFGGEFPNPQVIPRLYPLHIFLIPAAIVTALTVHLALVWHQTHTQFRAPGRTEETVTGSLTPGKYADFVILDRDIMTVPDADILGTLVTATYIGGRAVYERGR